jgi:trehalose synthase-fused probable maltokinase
VSPAPASSAPGTLHAAGAWASIFEGEACATLDARLPEYVAARRWFRGQSRQIEPHARKEPHETVAPPAVIAIVHVAYADGGAADDYALPLSFVTGDEADALRARRPHLVVAELHVQCAHASYDGVLCDAVGDTRALRALLAHVERADTLEGRDACLRFRRLGEGHDAARSASSDAEPRVIDAEQTNTSIVYGDAYILKVVRRLDDGASPDLEMGEMLTAAGYTHAPEVAGAAELVREGREPATLAILHRFVPNRGDAWSYMLGVIGRHVASTSATDAADANGRVRLLAERVASMHLALASRGDAPLFAPEPLAREERAALADAVRASLRRAFATLAARLAATPPSLPPDAVAVVKALVPREAELEERLRRFVDEEPGGGAWKTRVHGDLHLGQVLFTGDDFMIIDFEGEPARPLAERKAKRSPLADVAGMLRSLHYASISAARAIQPSSPAVDRAAAAWHDAARDAFLEAYLARVRAGSTRERARARFLPDDPVALRAMLDFYLLEKCVYEVHYEIDNRPDWVAIPAAGLAQLLEEPDAR